MSNPVAISVVIITYNEERNIERCIQSVEGLADEVLVVDSFSKDRTAEIAERMGARVLQHEFEGHIEQKNWAVSQSRNIYILSLDADEMIDKNLCEEILKIKNNWFADGYVFNRLNNYCGKWLKHGGWYPDKKLRLWDSRKGKWTGKNPHDEYVMEEGAAIKHIQGNILHYSFNSIQEHMQQVNYFTDLSARAYYHKGRKASLADVLIRPHWKFFRDYFIRLGFMDGYYGLIVCLISSFATFLKYLKLRELYKKGGT